MNKIEIKIKKKKGFCVLSNYFDASIEIFIFNAINMMCHTYLHILNYSCFPGINPSWPRCLISQCTLELDLLTFC